VISGITGSASGSVTIALDALGGTYAGMAGEEDSTPR
jgi:hypothetical protein